MTKSHGNHGKKVHRPYSSCISSVGNLMGTLSSSSCQLRLGVDLSHHSLRPYTHTHLTPNNHKSYIKLHITSNILL